MCEKRVSDTKVTTVRAISPRLLNSHGNLFGGDMVSMIDEIGGICGMRFAQTKVMSVMMDEILFESPVYAENQLELSARVIYAGRTSFVVKVEAVKEKSGQRLERACNAYITYVALGEDLRPTQVPALIPETEEEQEEWQMAVNRKQFRSENQKKGKEEKHV